MGYSVMLLLRRALLSALILSLVPFLILTVFSNPTADDYCYAAKTLEVGFFKAQSFWFNTWSGRYSANALLGLNPIVYGSLTGYKAVALIIITLTATSVFCLIAAFLNSSVGLSEKVIAAALITALFSNNMPDVTSGYYGMPEAISYQLPSILTLFLFAAVIRALDSTALVKIALLILGSILTIAIVGSSETSMVFLLFLVGAVTIKAFLIKSKHRWIWLGLLAIAILCSAVVISSPGNLIRSNYFPNRHRLLFSLGMSLAQEGRFIAKWLCNPALVLSTILFIPIAYNLTNKNALLKHRLYLHPLSSLFLLLILVFLGFFPPYWATGLLGQHTSVNTAYFFFLPGWFLNIAIWVGYFRERGRWVGPGLPSYVYLISLPILALSLLSTNNTRIAFADLITNRAYHYNQEMAIRHLQFEQCAKQRVAICPIQKMSDLPETVSNPYFETVQDCEGQYWRLRTDRSTLDQARPSRPTQ